MAMVVMSAVLVMVAIGMWVTFLPIWMRAIKTGRLLARGVTYDRRDTPVRYWAGFLGMLFITMLMSALAAGMIFDTAFRDSAWR